MSKALAVVYSRATAGIRAPLVTVESHLSNGLPSTIIVGLPEAAVRESRDRVRSALLTTHFEFPARRIIINLAPADLPKETGRFDLPIAIGILAASRQIAANTLSEYEFIGELALSGTLRKISGVLPIALACHQAKKTLVLPAENAEEAALVEGLNILPAKHLTEVCAHLNKQTLISPFYAKKDLPKTAYRQDMSDIMGQTHARRALEVAAAGQHSILFEGPPGTGKTMLASRLPSIVPPMLLDEALESAAILSISHHGFQFDRWKQRPFRSPHHSASSTALVGGGNPPRPGEISLAHQGILFLDELPEFNRHVLEALREPLESGMITISRAARQSEFPASFQLVAAMNPCPCGYLGDPEKSCQCTPDQIRRYRAKISGPFLDRIDLHLQIPRLSTHLITQANKPKNEKSIDIQQRVIAARLKQQQRANTVNAKLTNSQIEKYCVFEKNAYQLLESAMKQLKLSPRAYHRLLKVTRTIADLDNSEVLTKNHLSEALSFRRFEPV